MRNEILPVYHTILEARRDDMKTLNITTRIKCFIYKGQRISASTVEKANVVLLRNIVKSMVIDYFNNLEDQYYISIIINNMLARELKYMLYSYFDLASHKSYLIIA